MLLDSFVTLCKNSLENYIQHLLAALIIFFRIYIILAYVIYDHSIEKLNLTYLDLNVELGSGLIDTHTTMLSLISFKFGKYCHLV